MTCQKCYNLNFKSSDSGRMSQMQKLAEQCNRPEKVELIAE